MPKGSVYASATMPARKSTAPRALTPNNIIVKRALAEFWAGDRTAMADDLKVTAQAVWTWATGVHTPGPKVINAIERKTGRKWTATEAGSSGMPPSEAAAAINFHGRRLRPGEPGYEAVAMLLNRLFDEAAAKR